jgi:Recombination endonuclease VII
MVLLTPKEKAKDARLRREYNITLEEYKAMEKYQDGKCFICDFKPNAHQNSLAVDHDHRTGQVWGLVCWTCNKVVEMIRRDADRAQQLYNYITLPPAYAVLNEHRFTAPGRVGTKKRKKLLQKMRGNAVKQTRKV